ncbi:hypothetical protein DDW11_01845 [Sulfolobus sp. SCGC AB-777_G06]|nr:hypothetical protein DDW11_01845 [Sulfolobus sp. SCGC AB-777_G06]
MRNYYIVVTSVLLLTLNFNHPYFVLFLIPLLISKTNLRLPKVIGPLLLLLSLPFYDINITTLSLELVF